MIKTFLPEAAALERAVTYRDKKVKPLFIEMKNKIAAMAAQVKELTRERDNWKSKFQQKKQEARLSAAVAMLRDSRRHIAEIAEALGFSSPEHFSNAFRKAYGMSPSRYRKQKL